MNEAVERIASNNDWITIILLIIVALLVFNKLKNPVRFHKIQSLLLSTNYINDYSKSTPLLLNNFNMILIVVFTLVSSFVLLVAIRVLNIIEGDYTLAFYAKIVLYMLLFILFRSIVGLFTGMLFEKEKEQQFFTFMKMSYLGNFCLLITPLLIINFYLGSLLYSKIFLIIASTLFLFYYLLLVKNNQNLIFNKLFYFILYLCALEIAPFIIVYKLIIA